MYLNIPCRQLMQLQQLNFMINKNKDNEKYIKYLQHFVMI